MKTCNNSEVTFCYETNQIGQNNPLSRLKFIVTFLPIFVDTMNLFRIASLRIYYKDRHCTCNVTLSRVRATAVAVQKQ